MNHRLEKGFCAAISLCLIFSLNSCKKQSSSSSQTSDLSGISGSSASAASSGSPSSPTSGVSDKTYTTSMEAVQLAFAEAKKWKSSAVLWYVSPTALFIHYDWNNTDKAQSWTVGFANPDDSEEVLVYIRDGKVKPLSEESGKSSAGSGNNYINVGNKRKVECKAEFPKDTLKISMKTAVQTAVANGAPAGIMPENVVYDVESFGKAGKPLWLIVYKFIDPTAAKKDETWFFYVDGMTGLLVETGYQIDRTAVAKSKLTITGPDFSLSTALSDQRRTIVKFLALVNEGKSKDAAAMMTTSLVPDEKAKAVWVSTLDSIRGFQTGFVTEDNKQKWAANLQQFTVDLVVPANTDLQKYGWVEGKNKRYVTLKRTGNVWLIDVFSFQ
jgi:hypothetical protein